MSSIRSLLIACIGLVISAAFIISPTAAAPLDQGDGLFAVTIDYSLNIPDFAFLAVEEKQAILLPDEAPSVHSTREIAILAPEYALSLKTDGLSLVPPHHLRC